MERLHIRVLMAVAAAAAFLFLYDSGHAYLSDEVWSLRAVSLPFPQMMEELRGDLHPPLYYLLLRGWRGLVGEGEIAVRLLSILMCFGAGAFVFAAGKENWGARSGLMAATVFTVSPMVVTAGQMARMYGLLVLAAAASTYVFMRLLREERTPLALWALYVCANIAGSFAQVWFFFFLFGQAVIYLARHRGKRLTAMVLAAVLSLVPYGMLWLPTLVRQMKVSNATLVWIQPPVMGDLLATVLYLSGVAFLVVPFLWWNRPKGAGHGDLELSWLMPAGLFAITIVTPFVLSTWKPVYGQRFTVVALPALALAFAAITPKKLNVAVDLTLLSLACALGVAFAAFNQTNCDSRWTADYLARNAGPDDLVIFTSMSRLPTDYYWNQLQPKRAVTERTFPVEIDAHPGFEGSIHAPARRAQLRIEALEVARQAASKGKIFLFHGVRPKTDAILKDELDREMPKLKALAKSCPGSRSYFQTLTAYAGMAAPKLDASKRTP